MNLRLIAPACLAVMSTAVLAAFTGAYAPANWTPLTQTFGCGSSQVDVSGMPGTLVLRTATGCASIGATYSLTNPIPSTGTFNFDWSFTGTGGGHSGAYTLGGSTTTLASGVGSTSGSVSVPVTAGQTFNFGLAGGVSANLTITNFNFVPAVQAPTLDGWAKLGLAGLLAGAAVVAMRRRMR